MSAYVCDNETFNRVASSFWFSNNDWLVNNTKRELAKIGYPMNTKADVDAFALALFDMNCEAVNQRYGNGQAEEFRPLDYKPVMTIPCGKIQQYKSLQCLLYQCCEGNVYESPLYKVMEQHMLGLAKEIVCDLPQYEMAKWG